jgi:hypothetical protein
MTNVVRELVVMTTLSAPIIWEVSAAIVRTALGTMMEIVQVRSHCISIFYYQEEIRGGLHGPQGYREFLRCTPLSLYLLFL